MERQTGGTAGEGAVVSVPVVEASSASLAAEDGAHSIAGKMAFW